MGCKADGPGVPVSLQASNLDVDLSLEPRQKGLLWYSTYRVKFGGRYEITNPTDAPKCTTFEFKFPSEKAIYDNVRFLVGGKQITDLPIHKGKLTRALLLAPGQTEFVEVGYVTSGMDEWWYDFGSSVNQVKNFSLTMNTDFDQIDFPENGISATKKEKILQGLETSVGIHEPLEQCQNRNGNAAQAQPRTVGQPGELCGADLALSLLFSAFCHNHCTGKSRFTL